MAASMVFRALVVPLIILAVFKQAYCEVGKERLTSLLQVKDDEGPTGAQTPATLPGGLLYSHFLPTAAQAPNENAALLETAGLLHGALQTGAPDLKQALNDVDSLKLPFLSFIDPALPPRSTDRSSLGRRILEGGEAAASPAEAQRFTQDPVSVGEVLYTTSNSWLEVNYTQLVANVKEILPQIKPGAIPLAMVKGNGYGLGVLIAAQAFLEGGMQEIGVGDLNEALALRRAGITAPIQVCYQPDLQSAAAIARAPDLQVYVEDLKFIDALCKAAAAGNRSNALPVHIAVSTGAVREGVRSLAEALELARAVKNCQSLKLRGIMTHHGRLEVFLPIVEAVRSNISQDIIAHMASSTSGFFKGQQYHLDQVRLGTALYGSEKDTSAFRWLTRITGIKKVYVGDELGYSKTPQTKDMTIAVLDVGSIDGADDVYQAVVRGIVVPVVGDGGMNMHMLDVTNVPGVQVDDLVMLSGCCADDGTFMNNIWSPMIRPTVERIEVRGDGGVWMQERAWKSSGSSSGSPGTNISARH
ncbi:Alanine racemase [Coccomyxa sp. Obi]|nr:Alanine racemase [Coccomyxa sp. Obi]